MYGLFNIYAFALVKGAQVWEFSSLRFLWHKVSIGTVGDLRAEIKNLFFLNVGQIRTILSLLAYAPSTLATIFYFELAQKKKVVSSPPEVHLNVWK